MSKKLTTSKQCRDYIAINMSEAGYSDRDIKMLLAGATLLGYLADERASWSREFLTRKFFTNLEPFSQVIEMAGEVNVDALWLQKAQGTNS